MNEYNKNSAYVPDGTGAFGNIPNNINENGYGYGQNTNEFAQSNSQDRSRPINCDEFMSVTSFNDLEAYSKGVVVRLPDFADGMPFVARLRRPSMLALSKAGKIPNSLLTSANSLFEKGGKGADIDNPKMMSEMYDVLEIICQSALIQPTYREIIESGLSLTDEQMMKIFSYTQVGVKALESFRKEQKDFVGTKSE